VNWEAYIQWGKSCRCCMSCEEVRSLWLGCTTRVKSLDFEAMMQGRT
jgi:hypothetical protein